MAVVKFPLSVLSVTLLTTGVVVPDVVTGFVTCTALEATILTQSYAQPYIRVPNVGGSGTLLGWRANTGSIGIGSITLADGAHAVSQNGNVATAISDANSPIVNDIVLNGVKLVSG